MARGVLRRVVRETAFLKRSKDRRPLAGMVVRPHSDKGKSLLIQGMRKLGEKRAREDLSKMIEARAEGTDLHQAWKKRGSSSSKSRQRIWRKGRVLIG